MTPPNAAVPRTAAGAANARLAAFGEWLRRHSRIVARVQWIVVVAYVVLVGVPALLPLPPEDARWFNNLTVFAQWAFWGVWWPFVILSMFVVGRAWCGLFCPEGTLTEAASRVGLGRAVPRWLKWGGWPFVAFALTTIFGQLVSVYQYPAATLLVLGGSTVAAIGVGLVYGRGKRAWCRHLCPVNGVFAVLSRAAPVHFRVDGAAWTANAGRIRVHPVNCAPLVRIRRMTGPSECHMCARCSGLRGAIALEARSPSVEIATLPPLPARGWDAALIVFGMIGLALGAFEWSTLRAFGELRAVAVSYIVDHGPAWLLADNAPWWLLTNYPQAHDVFTWLDGMLIVGWIVGTAFVVGAWISMWLAAAARALPGGLRANAYMLAHALIPLAGADCSSAHQPDRTLAHNEGCVSTGCRGAHAPRRRGRGACGSRTGRFACASRGRRAVALAAFGSAVTGVLAAWVPFVFRSL